MLREVTVKISAEFNVGHFDTTRHRYIFFIKLNLEYLKRLRPHLVSGLRCGQRDKILVT